MSLFRMFSRGKATELQYPKPELRKGQKVKRYFLYDEGPGEEERIVCEGKIKAMTFDPKKGEWFCTVQYTLPWRWRKYTAKVAEQYVLADMMEARMPS